jgi:hypothetical protein
MVSLRRVTLRLIMGQFCVHLVIGEWLFMTSRANSA